MGVDVDKVNGEFQCFKNNGRENTGISLVDRLSQLIEFCPIEIVVTSIRKDGTSDGLDFELIETLSTWPGQLVISGGFQPKDIEKLKCGKNIHGVAVGKAFHAHMVSSEAFHSGELACADHHDLTKSLDLAVEYGIEFGRFS